MQERLEDLFGDSRNGWAFQGSSLDFREEDRSISYNADETRVGLMGATVGIALQDSATGRSMSQIRKSPNNYICHSAGMAQCSPNSVHRHVREVMRICRSLNYGPPADTARMLQRVNIDEAADLVRFQETQTAQSNVNALVALLAEDGELADFYGGEHGPLREWIAATARRVRAQVITHLLQNAKSETEVKKAKSDPEAIARIMFATGVALTDIDVFTQRRINETGNNLAESHYSVLGVALNGVRRSIVTRVLQEVAAWWPKDDFPRQEYGAHVARYAKNVAELRPARFNAGNRAEQELRCMLAQRLPAAVCAQLEANYALDRTLMLPVLTNTLRGTKLYERGKELAGRETFYPHGQASLIAYCSPYLVHYGLDGFRFQQTVGVHDPARAHVDQFRPAYPPDSQSYGTVGYINANLAKNGTAFFSPLTHLSPSPPYDDIAKQEEVLQATARALNERLEQLAVEHAEVFDGLREVSPMVFIDIPGHEIALFPSDESTAEDMSVLFDTQYHILPGRLVREPGSGGEKGVLENFHIAIGRGRWAALCLPPLAKRIAEQEAKRAREAPPAVNGAAATPPADTGEPFPERMGDGHAQMEIKDESYLRALYKQEIRGYTEPTLQDLLRILRDVAGVADVEHREKKGHGQGSHGEIVLRYADRNGADERREVKQNTWGKIQRSGARITWPTVFKMLVEEKLDVPLEEFLQAIQRGGHLRLASRKRKKGA